MHELIDTYFNHQYQDFITCVTSTNSEVVKFDIPLELRGQKHINIAIFIILFKRIILNEESENTVLTAVFHTLFLLEGDDSIVDELTDFGY